MHSYLVDGPSVRGRSATRLTVSRLAFIPLLATAVLTTNALFVSVLTAAIVVADVADGRVARRWSAEGPSRRRWDAVVDRCTIHAGFLALAFVHPLSLVISFALLARDFLVGRAALNCQRRLHTVVVGSGIHRLSSLALGLLGPLLVVRGFDPVSWAFIVCCAVICGLLARSYLATCRQLLSGLIAADRPLHVSRPSWNTRAEVEKLRLLVVWAGGAIGQGQG